MSTPHQRPRAALRGASGRPAAGIVLGLAFVMSLVTGDVEASAIPFAPAEVYLAGDRPLNVYIADLNGDGKADIAANNSSSDPEAAGVSILFNTGNGSFGPPVMIFSGFPTRCMAAGDFDGDTDVDLAVGLSIGPPLLVVLKNDGAGTFGPPIPSGSGDFRPDACHARDLDGDEDLDIVVALTGEAIAAVWVNPGDGDFSGPTFYMSDVPAYTSDLTVADFDGDEDLDLATVRTLNTDPPSLLRNQGDGTFGPAEPFYSQAFRHVALASGDVDLDGDEDLALITDGSSQMEIFRNDGAGTFELTDSYLLDSHQAIGSRIVLADLDGDTAPEAIIPERNEANVLVLRNDAAGGFAAPDPYSVAGEPTAVAAGDVDGDGDPDLAVTAFTTDRISRLLNLSPPAVDVPPVWSDPTDRTRVAMHPNPVQGEATILYEIPAPGPVRVTLVDTSGRLIAVVADHAADAGPHALSWDARGENGERLPAGRYIIRLEGRGVATVPVTLLR